MKLEVACPSRDAWHSSRALRLRPRSCPERLSPALARHSLNPHEHVNGHHVWRRWASCQPDGTGRKKQQRASDQDHSAGSSGRGARAQSALCPGVLSVLDSGGQTGTPGPCPEQRLRASQGLYELRSAVGLASDHAPCPCSSSCLSCWGLSEIAMIVTTTSAVLARTVRCSIGPPTRSLLEAEKDLDARLPATGRAYRFAAVLNVPVTAWYRESFVDMTNRWPAAACLGRWPPDLSLPPPCTPAAPALTQCAFAHPSCQVVGRP